MYFLASAIAFLISYFSFRLYIYTNSRQHLLLLSAFSFITIGLAILAIGNIVSFFNFDECKPHCRIDPTDPTYLLIRFGNYGYYLTSLLGYGLLALSYFKINFFNFPPYFASRSKAPRSKPPRNKVYHSKSKTSIRKSIIKSIGKSIRKSISKSIGKSIGKSFSEFRRERLLLTFSILPSLLLQPVIIPALLPSVDINILFPTQEIFVLYPFVNPYFQTFHVLSSVLLAYIIFQILPSYLRHKSKLSRLVLLSFLAILSYHILMYILPISATFFALAHFALLVGFGMLLFLLIKVNADERRERRQGKFATVEDAGNR